MALTFDKYMRILLVNFNLGATAGINNGLTILSAVLKKEGHEIKALFLCEEMGYGFDLSRIRKDVLAFGPGIIGVSLMETQFKYFTDFCGDVRRYYKGFLVCGGSYPTMSPEDILSVEGVDAVCVGEGDDAVLELVEAIDKKRDYRNTRNIWCKGEDGTLIKNRLRPFKDLKRLPPDDKELFDMDKLLELKNYQLEVMLGRGCIYECAYCINSSYMNRYREFCENSVKIGDYVRMKDPDTVIEEIVSAVKRHPQIRKTAFIDDNFLLYADHAEDFLKKYKEEIGLPFMCNANPLSFDSSRGRLLKEAGCDDVRFGVESGSERIKKDIMNRPVANRRVVESFNITKGLGLMTSSFNMVGLPTETREEVLETMRLNASIMPDTVKVMTFYPFKNTPLYELCVKRDLIDFRKKIELDNYDTFTCLKFPAPHRLFLKKIQAAFNWYINMFLGNESSPHYEKLIKNIEVMGEDDWNGFDFSAADKEASDKMSKKGIVHYSKFINRSLAVKFGARTLQPSGKV